MLMVTNFVILGCGMKMEQILLSDVMPTYYSHLLYYFFSSSPHDILFLI